MRNFDCSVLPLVLLAVFYSSSEVCRADCPRSDECCVGGGVASIAKVRADTWQDSSEAVVSEGFPLSPVASQSMVTQDDGFVRKSSSFLKEKGEFFYRRFLAPNTRPRKVWRQINKHTWGCVGHCGAGDRSISSEGAVWPFPQGYGSLGPFWLVFCTICQQGMQ